jgi:VWFA-related protein
MMRNFLLAAALALSLPVFGQPKSNSPDTSNSSAQQTAPAQNQRPPAIVTRTQTVVVPVTVKDSKGQLVGDLQKNDFRVFSDGIKQAFRFSSEAVPLSAVVLIDDDLPDRAVGQVQKSLAAVAAGFGPRDEVALVTYDQFPKTVFDFSFNNDQLFTQLKRLELTSHPTQVIADPTTAGPTINGRDATTGVGIPLHGSKRPENTNDLDDAIYAASGMLKDRPPDRRKIIFLISDGSNSRHNEHTFAETIRSLLEANVSVYSISITHTVPVGRSLVQHGASELDKYAVGTGGDTFFASKQPDLERLYSDVTEQARNEYTLTFSPEEADRTKDFHSIEVRVERPGLTIETRAGYYQSAISVGH